MNTVKLKFKYTQSEYVKADRQYLLLNKTIRKYDPIVFVMILLFSISYSLLSSFSFLSRIVIGIVLLVIVLESYLFFVMPVLKFKQTKKYHDEYTMIFSNDAIIWKTPSIEAELKWDIYIELWESEEFYYLIQNPRMFLLIPKRAFATKTERCTFEDIALANLNSVKRFI